MKKVLIIGKKGFIGNSLAKYLKNKFNTKHVSFAQFKRKKYIINDFNLVINSSINPNYISKKYEIIAIQKSLAIYRLHSNNFSLKNLDRYIEELSFWLKKNKNEKYNFYLLNYYLLKLRVKKFFKNLI